MFALVQYFGPTDGFDGGDLDCQAIAYDVDVIGRQPLVMALFIAVLKGWPGGIHSQA
ncbi:hypothetical protein D3C80_1887340 [compost metagenome]